LACVDGFALLGNVSDGNRVYGLFPVLSRHGVLADNEVMDTDRNAALYVGQSDHVLISGNRVHDNLIGIEVENSRHCTVLGNDVYANTVGLLVHVLPNLLRTTQEHTTIAFNKVHDNNRDPGAASGAFPPGLGILLVGADTTTVSGNHVTCNGSVGLGVVNPCEGLMMQGQSCDEFDVDPNPDGNRIVGNIFQGNGTAPPTGDLLWDGNGQGNCWQFNSFTTSVPSPLPACH
jgi:parallel beta-helix repeat protein